MSQFSHQTVQLKIFGGPTLLNTSVKWLLLCSEFGWLIVLQGKCCFTAHLTETYDQYYAVLNKQINTSCPIVSYCTHITYENLGFNPYLSYAIRDNEVTRLVYSVSPTSYDPLHKYCIINFLQEILI